MIKNENLPMPLKYCKQVVMEYKIYNEKAGYRVTYYYMPESGLWYPNINSIKNRLKTANIGISEWRTKWYLGKSKYQMNFTWAIEYVNLFYSEKPKYTKLEIIKELFKDSDYECDFSITKKDLIDLFYLTRKSEEEKKRDIDWSEVPERLKNKTQMFTLIVNETNPKTGEYPIRFSQTYDHLIRDRTRIPRYPARDKEKESKENGEIYFARAREKYGNKFDYSQSKYINSRTPITIKCNTCGNVYSQFPRVHLEKSIGCPFCANKNFEKSNEWEQRMDDIKDQISNGSNFEQLGKLYGCTGHQVGVMARKLGNIQEFRTKLKLEEATFIEDLKLKISNKEDLSVINIPSSFNEEYKNIFSNFNDIYLFINQGETVKNISEVYNVSKYILYDLLKLLNIEVLEIKQELKDELAERVRDFAENGYDRYTIIKELEITYLELLRISKKYEIPIKNSNSSGECFIRDFIKDNKNEFKWVCSQCYHTDILDSRVFVDFEIITYKGDRIIIEYNGEQHYRFVKFFHKTLENFEKRLYRDKRVREYCYENKIKYIEVPYTINTFKDVSLFLKETLFNNTDPNLLVDYKSLYKI